MNRQTAGKSILIIIEALILCVVLILGILSGLSALGNGAQTDTNNPQISVGDDSEAEDSGNDGVIEYVEVRLSFSEDIEAKIAAMTTEEKVAQLFVISPEKLTGVDPVTMAGNGTRTALWKYPVGGIVYSGKNFMGSEQTKQLLSNAQGYSMERIGLPLLTAVEEEGGIDHSPLASANLYTITSSSGELGNYGDTEMVSSVVASRMAYLTEDGFNMVLGPMANLAQGEDAAWDERTYGRDGAIAAEFIAAYVSSTNAHNVASVLRYFPKAGDASELTREELSVFQAGIDAGAKMIMVSNGKAESLTGDAALPCTLAAGTVTKLRGGMGFEGVLITASMSEERITSGYASGDAAVKAIVAGMDMIYEPADFAEAYDAVVAAVNDGTISQMRLENAVGRVLKMKME